MRSLADRFWSKVEKGPACWEWQASLGTHGYGQININGKPVHAHRVALQLAGVDVSGKCALHHCDNRKCVRPDHLFVGSKRDNSNDKVEKRRHYRGAGHHWAKLTDAQVREIRSSRKTQAQLAREFGVNQSHVARLKAGARRADL